MSKTLNLIRRLLARGRKLHKLGVDRDARLTLTRLAAFQDLPAGVAEEVQRRLAELLLKRGKYARARRHLAALLHHQPQNPHYHYLMARAVEKDVRAEPKRAVAYYRQALALEPRHPRYLADFGLAALRTGKVREGLEALRQALEAATDDPRVVAKVVEGLGQRGRYGEALRALRGAMFRNPREPRFRRLWNDVRFRPARPPSRPAAWPAPRPRATARPCCPSWLRPRPPGRRGPGSSSTGTTPVRRSRTPISRGRRASRTRNMRNSPPDTRPEGRRTRPENRPPAPGPRPRLLGALSALTVVGVSTCLGGWAGAVAGLWAGRVFGLLRLGFSTGLTVGTFAGLIVGLLVALATRPAKR
jgi:tetratricopeptide (TPR) repeat protein